MFHANTCMLSGSLTTMPRPQPTVDSACECTEQTVADSQQRVVLQPYVLQQQTRLLQNIKQGLAEQKYVLNMVGNIRVPLQARNLLPNSDSQGLSCTELMSCILTRQDLMLLLILILYKQLLECLVNIIGIVTV